MAIRSFATLAQFLGEVGVAWREWGDSFSVDGQTKTDIEAKMRELEALNFRITEIEMELKDLQFERNALADSVVAFSVRLRIALLARFGKESHQLKIMPVLRDKRRGAPSKATLTRRANAAKKKEALEKAQKEAFKAQILAELAREKQS